MNKQFSSRISLSTMQVEYFERRVKRCKYHSRKFVSVSELDNVDFDVDSTFTADDHNKTLYLLCFCQRSKHPLYFGSTDFVGLQPLNHTYELCPIPARPSRKELHTSSTHCCRRRDRQKLFTRHALLAPHILCND